MTSTLGAGLAKGCPRLDPVRGMDTLGNSSANEPARRPDLVANINGLPATKKRWIGGVGMRYAMRPATSSAARQVALIWLGHQGGHESAGVLLASIAGKRWYAMGGMDGIDGWDPLGWDGMGSPRAAGGRFPVAQRRPFLWIRLFVPSVLFDHIHTRVSIVCANPPAARPAPYTAAASILLFLLPLLLLFASIAYLCPKDHVVPQPCGRRCEDSRRCHAQPHPIPSARLIYWPPLRRASSDEISRYARRRVP